MATNDDVLQLGDELGGLLDGASQVKCLCLHSANGVGLGVILAEGVVVAGLVVHVAGISIVLGIRRSIGELVPNDLRLLKVVLVLALLRLWKSKAMLETRKGVVNLHSRDVDMPFGSCQGFGCPCFR